MCMMRLQPAITAVIVVTTLKTVYSTQAIKKKSTHPPPHNETGAIGVRDANSEDWSHWCKRRQQRGLEPLVEETPTARTGAIGGRDARSGWEHLDQVPLMGDPRFPSGCTCLLLSFFLLISHLKTCIYLNSASMMGHLVENWPRK